MRNLNDFLLPNKDGVCLCEIDGRPYYSEDSYDKVSIFTLAVSRCISNGFKYNLNCFRSKLIRPYI